MPEERVKLTHTITETREEIARARRDGKLIGLVPTMGALHDGHISLIRRAREECGFVVVSVFVNPTQFGPSEDLDDYPRNLDSDIAKCHEAGANLIFTPCVSEMYPSDFDSWVEVKGPLTEVLEGASRPGHFRGVTTVCAKLFNTVQPDRAYFGLKDYQQCKIVQQMVRDLNMSLEIVPCETVREPDGLAMSSRNRYLNAEERCAALALSKALQAAQDAFGAGERNARAVQVLVENLIKAEHLARIDYVAVADAGTLQPIDIIKSPAAVLLAVHIGSTRLIDNCLLVP